ncbi:MAG: carbon-nitrogen hydrolase family protein [Anaerolineales bacterium]|nr:carbon-nitrogen hydrolase family protein [Anaerolineales bacterium]
MRVTVCELADDPTQLPEAWRRLAQHVEEARSELVLLPEMAFGAWFPRQPRFEAATWQAAVAAHDRWIARLPEMAPALVLGSRPVHRGGRRFNEAFIWDSAAGYRAVHTKRYLPDEDRFWEASWYERGDGRFIPGTAGPALVGFAVCTDLWFFEHARAYGQAGVHLIANPRATELATIDRWLVAGRAAAVAAGAYCLSSNRVGAEPPAGPMGGQGWVVGPDAEVLALTSPRQPWVTVDIDLTVAEHARRTYPRYVA